MSAAELIRQRIVQCAAPLGELSRQIHSHPELSFQEHFAHDQFITTVKQLGLPDAAITPHYAGLDTAFRVEATSADYDPKKHATVCFCAEYDALPGIGHACGHNLIGEASLGAFVGLAAALKSGLISGRAVLLGTPAEEGGGGKIKLIDRGAFRDIDFAMMAHGGPYDAVYSTALSTSARDFVFTGRASHASAQPWGGLNALDACVAAYTNLAMLRQQMKPTCRLHAIIKEGGLRPNIIPKRTVLCVQYRARTVKERNELEQRAIKTIQAGADAHGCQVEMQSHNDDYRPLLHNPTLADLYGKYETEAGVKFMYDDELKSLLVYSTDMGDVSLTLPSIHPNFMPGDKALGVMPHTVKFCEVVGEDDAQPPTLRVAGSMACAAAEVLQNNDLLKKMKVEFEEGLKKYT